MRVLHGHGGCAACLPPSCSCILVKILLSSRATASVRFKSALEFPVECVRAYVPLHVVGSVP